MAYFWHFHNPSIRDRGCICRGSHSWPRYTVHCPYKMLSQLWEEKSLHEPIRKQPTTKEWELWRWILYSITKIIDVPHILIFHSNIWVIFTIQYLPFDFRINILLMHCKKISLVLWVKLTKSVIKFSFSWLCAGVLNDILASSNLNPTLQQNWEEKKKIFKKKIHHLKRVPSSTTVHFCILASTIQNTSALNVY